MLIAVVVATLAVWSVRQTFETSRAPAADGAVVVQVPTPAPSITAPSATAIQAPSANLPVAPDIAVAHVRRAYPRLMEVALACDVNECALTATIPPPTGDDDVKKREELLLGGLAATLGADGYRMLAPVQMKEIDDNKFRIRASIPRERKPPAQIGEGSRF
ncbi:hypothetical protein NDN01_11415 [Sphingomonas sp. QA11]|uniref:hypothetical protein n=1 Tax=Sphingomonas sp. QA11 TaxID=2950605 RepID=UPI002349453B|nr:hypothetical protein [Sphingomonas sp. QA11]WCM29445.1 hypothetical protein NDN01_11415 [Sphingomonas sp. QA11]